MNIRKNKIFWIGVIIGIIIIILIPINLVINNKSNETTYYLATDDLQFINGDPRLNINQSQIITTKIPVFPGRVNKISFIF